MVRAKRWMAAGLVLGASAAARADVLYSGDFENWTAGPAWSANTFVQEAAPFTKYVGRYSGTDSVVLTLAAPSVALAPGESVLYRLEFDFIAIDSWDGYEANHGPDWFRVSVNNATLFEETFSNQHPLQSYRPPDVGPAPMAYGVYNDAIYRDIGLEFEAPGASGLSIRFKGNVLQGMADESWGIDNVSVTYTVIPGPGALAVVGLGCLGLARRRR